ncbi:diguanylate cyclase [Desulfovibrio oxyclinae]|uniref:diguanylate cyclase n=1 Tax=Desulfovibrio oxyclinae TaxID=63560 RepID=UPI00036625BF|nr:diguanylate cyclase [Desulfovibrio oxyclinae]
MDRHTILLVEDSRFFGQMVRDRIEEELDLSVDWATSMAEAISLIEARSDDYLAVLHGLSLPDADEGDMARYVTEKGLPALVFTATFSNESRHRIAALGVADYVLKENPKAIDTVLDTIRRIRSNPDTRVLVVDDSPTALTKIRKLLQAHRYEVLTAADGKAALRIMDEVPDIKLVLTDFNMPSMDGFELTRRIRENFPKDRLAIIGLSSERDEMLSARFIKLGANDFLKKPFIAEEFYCRVQHSLDMLQQIETIRELSYRDPLTKLANRRCFFESAQAFIHRAQQAGERLCLAMLDIDHFKKVNDTYGHDTGDAVISNVATLLDTAFPEGEALTARFGGEEFAVLLRHAPERDPVLLFDGFRRTLEQSPAHASGGNISVTISTGLCLDISGSLHQTLSAADENLYRAKEQGRNRVVSGVCELKD